MIQVEYEKGDECVSPGHWLSLWEGGTCVRMIACGITDTGDALRHAWHEFGGSYLALIYTRCSR